MADSTVQVQQHLQEEFHGVLPDVVCVSVCAFSCVVLRVESLVQCLFDDALFILNHLVLQIYISFPEWIQN